MTACAKNYRWLWGCIIILTAIFILLSAKLVKLQIFKYEEYKEMAEANTQRKYIFPATRGQIKDSRGNVFAMSVPVKTICADPSLLGNYYPEIARILSPILKINQNELTER
ncbi:MAG TPA: hypothetical protein PLW02_10945, partial [Verrucomicrobiota bacterium]|nr:hypothetical protein [Verrucomicrobiota bacterium]